MPHEDDIPEIPPEELAMAIDEDNLALGRGPERRAAEHGVADMKARIKYLEEQLQKVATNLSCMGTTEYEVKTLVAVRTRLNSELTDAQFRLREYQAQLNKN